MGSQNLPISCFQNADFLIGVSLSEPHTREFGAEISVRMLVSVGLRVQIAGQNVCVSMAEQLLTPSQQVTGSIPGNDMLFFPRSSFCNVHACASAASAACIATIGALRICMK